MPYPIGELDQRISFERIAQVSDGAGGVAESWSAYDTVWARIRPLSGREREQAQRLDAVALYLVVVRARADVLEADRIVWGDRRLNIRFIRARGVREQFLEIEAEMGVGN